jgi:hypothetical protein
VNYADFIRSKLTTVPPTGLATVPALHPSLFPFQADLVTWALKRGRAAIFCDTGLGKTRQQLEWARCVAESTGGRILVLTPLAVAAQTVREASTIGIEARQVRTEHDVREATERILVTNYDRLHLMPASEFAGVVLDESSIIKNSDSKTLAALMSAFEQTPFRLCATATPSPNDYTELGTHAEFLGVCSREEMLAEFFCHDGGETQKWRLKGHARTAFWRWVSTWGALLRRPSDLGYDDAGYALPPLTVETHMIAADPEETKKSGLLFAEPALTLTERRDARRSTTDKRVAMCAELVMGGMSWLGQKSTENSTCETTTSAPRATGRPPQESRESDTTPPSEPSTPLARNSGPRRARKLGRGKLPTLDSEQSNACESTELPLQTEIACSESKAGVAPFAEEQCQSTPTKDETEGAFTSTTATPPASSEASSAHPATSESESSATIQKGSKPQLDTFVVWCELNDEQNKLARIFGDECVSIMGADDNFTKELMIGQFLRGEKRIMLTKPSIAGMGLNLQFCHRMAFVGVTDSFERTYQAIRRCWRFGQKHPVDVHFFASELEGAVVENYQRKERDAVAMSEQLSAETRDAVKAEVRGSHRVTNAYEPARIVMPEWMKKREPESD